MNMRQLVCTIAGVLALAGLNGCKTESHTHSSELSDGRMVDDKNITEHIKDDLKNDPVYKFGDINVSTYAGLVQLSGFVNTEGEKQRAQSVAQSVRGVTRVENGITVKPIAPTPTGYTNQNNKIYSQ